MRDKGRKYGWVTQVHMRGDTIYCVCKRGGEVGEKDGKGERKKVGISWKVIKNE